MTGPVEYANAEHRALPASAPVWVRKMAEGGCNCAACDPAAVMDLSPEAFGIRPDGTLPPVTGRAALREMERRYPPPGVLP